MKFRSQSRPGAARLLLSLLALLWAIFEMMPLRDRPVAEELLKRSHHAPEIAALVKDTQAVMAIRRDDAFPAHFRALADDSAIDLGQYFRGLSTEGGTLEQRNRRLMSAILRRSRSPIRRGLDLQGGLSVTLEIAPDALAEREIDRLSQLGKVEEIMRRRIDSLGVSEPIIRCRGASQVEIQLAGVFHRDNPDLLNVIRKPAKLEFRLVHEDADRTDGLPPIGYEWLPLEGEAGRRILVRRIPELIGRSVKNAQVLVNSYGGYEIGLEFTGDGSRRFAAVTGQNVGRQLAIVLDGKVYSAPLIRSAIPNGKASISGHFSREDALNLANVLNNPLEFELQVAEVHELGPTLAENVRTNSLHAAVLGASLVILFMVGYYGLAGLVSVLSIGLNVALILGAMAMVGTTLTLPGIAALVLTIGMSVDANILIFSRMKEELKRGASLGFALQEGFHRAFNTILDANLTTLLTALILMFYGTGPIKGFGIILAMGIVATIFCALVFCRGLLDWLVEGLKVKRLMPGFFSKTPAIDFMRWRSVAFVLSFILIALGLVAVGLRGKNVYGIDFTGGDEMLVAYTRRPDLQSLDALAKAQRLGEFTANFQRSFGENDERLKIQTAAGRGLAFVSELQQNFPANQFQLLSQTSIGGSVGANIRWNALVSVILAMVGILLYVAVRFEVGFGMGAIVSTLHDVLITIGLFVLAGHQFSGPMVAAILMVVGYSINDTIVVFDRIREELPAHPNMSLRELINFATNQTLSRTILTSLTTLLSAIALYIFGDGIIVDFSLVFIIGILTGTFSSIFIASPVFYWWHRGRRAALDGR